MNSNNHQWLEEVWAAIIYSKFVMQFVIILDDE